MIFIGRRNSFLGAKKRTIERRFFLGPVSAKVVFFIILAAFSIFYLSQSSQIASRKIVQSGLEKDMMDKQNEIDQIKLEGQRLKALSDVQSEAEKKGMEPASL
ncbi:MAG: hypothetical protein OEV37_02710 [Candidatus Berkelbacteria bacterium]|nr:hypothetical protein [Candidatus Berkelbacteria bacterium]